MAIPIPEAFRAALFECPEALGPTFVLEEYGEAAKRLWANVELFGREGARVLYRDLLADEAVPNSYNAAWVDAFGGTSK